MAARSHAQLNTSLDTPTTLRPHRLVEFSIQARSTVILQTILFVATWIVKDRLPSNCWFFGNYVAFSMVGRPRVKAPSWMTMVWCYMLSLRKTRLQLANAQSQPQSQLSCSSVPEDLNISEDFRLCALAAFPVHCFVGSGTAPRMAS